MTIVRTTFNMTTSRSTMRLYIIKYITFKYIDN